jgi:hypothetical protein
MADPKQEQLRDTFLYLFESDLYWKNPVTSRTIEKTRLPAGNLCKDGYVRIALNKQTYSAHRLVWIYHHGDIPEGLTIDHKDGDRSNNRIDNLQLATRQQQQFNRKKGIPTYIRCTGRAYNAIIKFNDGTTFKKQYAKEREAFNCPEYQTNLHKKFTENGVIFL